MPAFDKTRDRRSSARASATPPTPPTVAQQRGTQSIVAGPDALFDEVDILARLPEPARRKMERLRAELSTLFLVEGKESEVRAELSREKAQLLAQLNRGRIDPDDPNVRAAQARIERLNAEIARNAEARDVRDGRLATLAPLMERIERYLARQSGPVTLYGGKPPSPRKGEAPLASVQRVRQEIAQAKAGLHTVRSAPIPSAVAKAKIKAEVEALAERGEPDTSPILEYSGSIEWPKESLHLEVFGAAMVDGKRAPVTGFAGSRDREGQPPDALGIMAWLFKSELIKALESQIDQDADDANALTDEEREAKERELLSAILHLERDEEFFIEQTHGEVARRPDADPRAVLGLT
jgi:hypothetical protein